MGNIYYFDKFRRRRWGLSISDLVIVGDDRHGFVARVTGFAKKRGKRCLKLATVNPDDTTSSPIERRKLYVAARPKGAAT